MLDDLKDLKGLADKFLNADEEEKAKYKEAAEKGIKAAEKAVEFLKNLSDGDAEKVKVTLTEFEDVNRTLEAAASMEEEIGKLNSVQLEDVLDVIGTVGKVTLTLGAAIL